MNLNFLTPAQDRIAGSLESIAASLDKQQSTRDTFTYNLGSAAVAKHLLETISKEKLKGASDSATLLLVEKRLHDLMSSLKTGIKTAEVVVAP